MDQHFDETAFPEELIGETIAVAHRPLEPKKNPSNQELRPG
jgi:hypothetical protein